MFYLSKILPFFLLPLGLVCMLMAASFLTRNRWLGFAALCLLYTSSVPWVGRALLSWVEVGQERRLPSDVAEADAIVVLSGGRTFAPGSARVSEWNDADRFFGGIELFKTGKAPLLVFTGGAAPWEPNAPMEGTILVRFAQDLGVPASALRTTGKVLNTSDEARAVSALEDFSVKNGKQKARILLVTSAFHMPRAQRVFEKSGFSIEPYPVDFLVPSGRVFDVTDLLPSPKGLSDTTLALRETYGRLMARLF